MIFDRYFDNSLKEGTRRGRGMGSRLVFGNDTPLPRNMQDDFLKNIQNKNDLNEFLAKQFIQMHTGPKLITVSYKETAVCSPPSEPINISSFVSITRCQSEEADQRLVRHILHCLSYYERCERVVVCTIDTMSLCC